VHSVAGGTFMNGVVQVVAPPATPTPTVTALLSPTPTPPAAAGPGGAIPTLDEMGLALLAGALALVSVILIVRPSR
ncbi:MAG TPA: IPTL-CTERM sorting domain-containing protein, partial [Thermoanaerobaculia bacterium]